MKRISFSLSADFNSWYFQEKGININFNWRNLHWYIELNGGLLIGFAELQLHVVDVFEANKYEFCSYKTFYFWTENVSILRMSENLNWRTRNEFSFTTKFSRPFNSYKKAPEKLALLVGKRKKSSQFELYLKLGACGWKFLPETHLSRNLGERQKKIVKTNIPFASPIYTLSP